MKSLHSVPYFLGLLQQCLQKPGMQRKITLKLAKETKASNLS